MTPKYAILLISERSDMTPAISADLHAFPQDYQSLDGTAEFHFVKDGPEFRDWLNEGYTMPLVVIELNQLPKVALQAAKMLATSYAHKIGKIMICLNDYNEQTNQQFSDLETVQFMIEQLVPTKKELFIYSSYKRGPKEAMTCLNEYFNNSSI